MFQMMSIVVLCKQLLMSMPSKIPRVSMLTCSMKSLVVSMVAIPAMLFIKVTLARDVNLFTFVRLIFAVSDLFNKNNSL